MTSRFAFVATAASLLLFTFATEAGAAGDQRLGGIIDRHARSVSDQACHGLAIGAEDHQARASGFYGRTGNHGTPTADTLFQIGSVTKTFTATLLAWAVQKGDVRLDDPLQKYVPDRIRVPQYNGRKVLLADLAEHTAGFPRMPPITGNSTQPDEVWHWLNNFELKRAPGDKFVYSNLGFGILGLALARVEDTALRDLYTSVITGPLGLPDTRLYLDNGQTARRAVGYDAKGNVAPYEKPGSPALNGAGALYSTLADQMRYLDYELGRIQSPLTKLLPMLHQARHAAGAHSSVGLGWQMRKLPNGTQIIFKDGARPGFSAFIVFAPSTMTGVVVLANQAKCPVPKIANGIMADLNKGQSGDEDDYDDSGD